MLFSSVDAQARRLPFCRHGRGGGRAGLREDVGNATSELADAGLDADSGLPPGACHLDEDGFLDFGGEGSCLFATGAACGTYGTCLRM